MDGLTHGLSCTPAGRALNSSDITVYERKCIVIEIGLSLGILYIENRTLGIKDYTNKHDDVFFNFIFILLIAISTD